MSSAAGGKTTAGPPLSLDVVLGAKVADGPSVDPADEWESVGRFASFQEFRELVKETRRPRHSEPDAPTHHLARQNTWLRRPPATQRHRDQRP